MGGWQADRSARFGLGVLGFALVVWVWMLFQGYGPDNDTYLMLRTWQVLLSEHRYDPSRFQGSVVPELLLGAAAWAGGPLLSNLAVLACTLCALAALWGLMSELDPKSDSRILALATLAASGPFLTVGASSMDYMPALALFVGGLWLMTRGEDVAGVLLVGASAGARISYAGAELLAIPAVLAARYARDGQKPPLGRLVQYPLAAFVVSGLFYLPVWFEHGLRLDFLSSSRPVGQGIGGLAVRFAYKVYLYFGLTGLMGAAIGLAMDVRRPRGATPDGASRRLLILCALLVAFHLALFFYIPVDVCYLIPAMAFLVVGLSILNLKRTLVGLCLGQLAALVVVLDPLAVSHQETGACGPVIGTGAHIHPHLAPGYLPEDQETRARLNACNYALLKKAPANLHGRLPSG